MLGISSFIVVVALVTGAEMIQSHLRLQKKINPKIINGDKASENQFPFHVGIQCDTGEKNCAFSSGSIISDQYVLTAAHSLNSKV